MVNSKLIDFCCVIFLSFICILILAFTHDLGLKKGLIEQSHKLDNCNNIFIKKAK